MTTSPGQQFRNAIAENKPLPIAGAINAYTGMLAEQVGFRALYVSGGGVAAASYGIPDLGITSLEDVLIDVRRLADATKSPILVDVDTGWGSAFNIARTVRSMAKAGAAAIHIEDQVQAKRCGHRPGKMLVSTSEMVDRIKAAVDAKPYSDFVIMARTDSIAVEGMAAAVDRAAAYVDAGADMLFPEAVTELSGYERFASCSAVPVLANVTEFGKTPLFSQKELGLAGVSMVLYPLSAFRAMSKVALATYQAIIQEGTQARLLDTFQTRADLYACLNYDAYERHLDALFAQRD